MWTINSVRFYVQEHGGEESALIARLSPRGGGTILHWFGYEETADQIEALVLTTADRDSILAMKDSNTSYALVSPEGSLGNWFVKKVSWRREDSVQHVFFDRPSVSIDAPLYRVSLEIYPDV